MRVLVLGASGMLGSAILRVISECENFSVYGTLRSKNIALEVMAPQARLIYGVDVDKSDSLLTAFSMSRPDVVINCIGLIKQLAESEEPLRAIPINSILPHYLARVCKLTNSRLVHISTDCVFSGRKGFYSESDIPDAEDIYGRSKLLGEVDYPHAITLRTSIIGHELASAHSLIDWFLMQEGVVRGYTHAIFSGLPTFELANIICNFVIPNKEMHGLYHVAASPIAKYDLLKLVSRKYGKVIQIESEHKPRIDRSLDASRFNRVTGYSVPTWEELVSLMYKFH